MPNWTFCKLEAPSDVLKKYISKDDEGNNRFDFNLVIPRPEVFNDPELIDGGDTDDCIYWYLSDKGKFDFKQTLSKYPYMFRGYFNFFNPSQEELVLRCQKKSEEYFRRGKKYFDAYKEYGCRTWYEWSNKYWGTKWNACDSYIDEGENPMYVEFNTAWCYPEPVIKKIFDDNPGCYMEFWWADEDYDGDHCLCRHEDGTITETTEEREPDYEL